MEVTKPSMWECFLGSLGGVGLRLRRLLVPADYALANVKAVKEGVQLRIRYFEGQMAQKEQEARAYYREGQRDRATDALHEFMELRSALTTTKVLHRTCMETIRSRQAVEHLEQVSANFEQVSQAATVLNVSDKRLRKIADRINRSRDAYTEHLDSSADARVQLKEFNEELKEVNREVDMKQQQEIEADDLDAEVEEEDDEAKIKGPGRILANLDLRRRQQQERMEVERMLELLDTCPRPTTSPRQPHPPPALPPLAIPVTATATAMAKKYDLLMS